MIQRAFALTAFKTAPQIAICTMRSDSEVGGAGRCFIEQGFLSGGSDSRLGAGGRGWPGELAAGQPDRAHATLAHQGKVFEHNRGKMSMRSIEFRWQIAAMAGLRRNVASVAIRLRAIKRTFLR